MIYLIISIILGATGHVIAKFCTYNLKSIFSLIANPYFYFATGCYGFSFVFWILFLKGRTLSSVVPLNSLTYIVVAVLSHFVFGEQLKPVQYLGIAVIVLGVFLLER